MHWAQTKDWCGRGLDLKLIILIVQLYPIVLSWSFLSWVVSTRTFKKSHCPRDPVWDPNLPLSNLQEVLCDWQCLPWSTACGLFSSGVYELGWDLARNADSTGSFSWKAWIPSANLRTCRILLNGLHQDLQEVELHLGGFATCTGGSKPAWAQQESLRWRMRPSMVTIDTAVWSSSKLVVDSLGFRNFGGDIFLQTIYR